MGGGEWRGEERGEGWGCVPFGSLSPFLRLLLGRGMPKEWGFLYPDTFYEKGFFPLWPKEEDGGKIFLILHHKRTKKWDFQAKYKRQLLYLHSAC